MSEHSNKNDLVIPLMGWFSRSSGMAIPYASLPYTDPKNIITIDDAIKAYPEFEDLINSDIEYGRTLIKMMYIIRGHNGAT